MNQQDFKEAQRVLIDLKQGFYELEMVFKSVFEAIADIEHRIERIESERKTS